VNRPRNNLDALRLFAAMLVLVGHSYIFMGVTDPIFLAAVPLGPLGVSIFFVISGYLVSESWDRDPDAVRFLARRALRIVPGLAVCIFLTAFLLGPALTTLPLSAYFKHPTVWDYLYNIGLYISYSLPGVFEKNRIAHSVNGSLWSLPVEFLLYLVVALVGIYCGQVFGIPELDGAASVVIGAILGMVAVFLAYESKGLLIGESVNTDVKEDIRRIAEADTAIVRLGRLMTMHFGPHDVLLTMEIHFDPLLSADSVAAAIDRVEKAIRSVHPDVKHVFIEAQSLTSQGASNTDAA